LLPENPPDSGGFFSFGMRRAPYSLPVAPCLRLAEKRGYCPVLVKALLQNRVMERRSYTWNGGKIAYISLGFKANHVMGNCNQS
jgi:hypothetical protein